MDFDGRWQKGTKTIAPIIRQRKADADKKMKLNAKIKNQQMQVNKLTFLSKMLSVVPVMPIECWG